MKKMLSILLAASLAVGGVLSGCGSNTNKDAGSTAATDSSTKETTKATAAPEWKGYDDLIKKINTTLDLSEREALLHDAEDMLMETGAVMPLFHQVDIWMLKDGLSDLIVSNCGYKYFMYMTGTNGTLRACLASEPEYLDPALNTTVDGACLAVNSFEGLYKYTKDDTLIPALAEDTQISDDGLTYTFTLKDGLKWSDGSDLTAADFAYAWNRAAADETASSYQYLYDVVARNDDGTLNVTASEDGKTITVVLNSPCAYFLKLLAFPAFLPVKQSAVESAEGYESNPGAWASEAGFVSNGAYTLESWKHNESMVYVKNPNYYDADNVTVDRLEFMLSADDTAIYAAYKSGDLDFIDSLPINEIPSVMDSSEFGKITNLGTTYVTFNVNSDLFAGKTVEEANTMRKALSLLVDRQYMVDSVCQSGQEPANSFVPEGMSDGHDGIFNDQDDDYTYPDKEAKGYYSTEYSEDSREEAIEMLKSIGYEFDDSGMLSANTPIAFEYLTNDASLNVGVAEALQQDFASIGIDMTIKTEEWQVFISDRRSGKYEVARGSWLADYDDPISMLEMFTSNSGNNDPQFGK
ncbi:peptide/nickel transport system substrate-binding protein/oligopeptide transport system substrate-binding protein [Acetitomaculum ruminis DSM 5522]|uniref:Peptide/nickel transport system substrate-binding protein/oligopeptide transport system substrate-binding protein n=1 Tax=Acetitomaculum ruminis DSM 5522 TaxID=1120918 RepID=A0A1I0X1S2_9FIRM|nr:peptide ABC transporter substrate-binding protein [Acetitomaculum ruminis]SFA94053.1 peptide/nickel transport system substrate-binding protein/oligopeptide transport system substrate-binding protein [Acetitomaculum ruminis DSM 5522]